MNETDPDGRNSEETHHESADTHVDSTEQDTGSENETQIESEVVEAPAKPRLSTGARAVAHSKDATLKSLGVATQRMAGEVIPEADDDAEGGFDPAADMPMYRPGMDWFVLRVASNKESSVRETLLRKVQIETMEERQAVFGAIDEVATAAFLSEDGTRVIACLRR